MAERTRREREQERNRQEMISAAVDLFHEQGYHGTAVQEIAKKAEFGVGTLYRMFPEGKEAIFLAMQELVVTMFERELAAAVAGEKDEVEIIRGYIIASARVYQAYPKEMSVYMKHIAGVGLDLSRGLPPDLAKRYLACVGVASGAIRKGIENGRFRKMNPEAATMSLRAVINTWFTGRLEGAWPVGPEECIDQIFDLFFAGILVR